MKGCYRCHEEKPLADFTRHRNGPQGYSYYCRSCTRAQAVERFAKDPEGITLRRRNEAIARHGLTLDQYDDMLAEQGWACAVCGEGFGSRPPAIDHDHSCCEKQHSCGKCVRGILCVRCNVMLGMARDDTAILTEAIRYLSVMEVCSA